MIAIIEYNAGNIGSVQNALTRLGYNSIITADAKELKAADHVIFAGVGAAGPAMKHIQANGIDTLIKSLKQPMLGICLGLQLMCQHTEEDDTACLGIFDVNVKLFPPEKKVPHMGWNNLSKNRGALFQDLNSDEDVYFVHSYYAEKSPCTTAECEYILPFSAALQKDNFYATQFHPEKSAEVGEQILKKFLQL